MINPSRMKTYYCDCEKYCHGNRKEVPRRTYYNHKKYRDALPKYGAAFLEYLDQHRSSRRLTEGDIESGHQEDHTTPVIGVIDQDAVEASMRTSVLSPGSVDASASRLNELPSNEQIDVHDPHWQLGSQLDTLSHGTGAQAGDFDPYASMDEPRHEETFPVENSYASASVPNPPDTPLGDIEYLWKENIVHLESLKVPVEFIKGIHNAILDDPSLGLSAEAIDRLRNPIHSQPGCSIDEDTLTAIELYLLNPSEATFNPNRSILAKRLPSAKIPTYYRTSRKVAELTGIESVVHHMCINSCVVFTGPYSDLDNCPICTEPRYDQFRLESTDGEERVPRQEFHTIPIGPQIQALYRDPASATRTHYLRNERARVLSEIDEKGFMDEYSDVLHGTDLIRAFDDGRVMEDDIVLMFSVDGAQLYAKKASACWIYIWILFNLSPDRRYKKKHVFIGGFIPGPNNPKNLDSFLFPGLAHLSAIQKEGLRIWDSSLQREINSKVFLALLAADGPGMMHITGFVGYHGKHGCRLFCGLPGRREQQGKHYFPALLKPKDYAVKGCDHLDIDVKHLPEASCEEYHEKLRELISSRNERQYRLRRLDTGISKPSIFSGLDPRFTLGLPKSAGSDIMHLGALNIPDLMLSLWRGVMDCTKPDDRSTWTWSVLQGDVWEEHGQAVADTLYYLPSSFERPPRNIADKITSGYKAWEFLVYLYGLGPGLLYGILPEPYYSNYCKLVFGIRLLNQHKITRENMCEAHLALASFAQEFEIIYCQRLATRIHFVRPCLHSLVHLPREVSRLGPPICSSQWTLERTIGNLGEEIKQHSNPFSNLSQRGIRRARVNALKAMIPQLDVGDPDEGQLPRGSRDLGDGFILLRARETDPSPLRNCEADALRKYLGTNVSLGSTISVRRWAKLRIPTGQNCYSAWKEKQRPLEKRRTARNVKILLNGEIRIAEVYFFVLLAHEDRESPLALVSLYSMPNTELLRVSSNTLCSCEYKGDDSLHFIDAKTIQAVVAMVPHTTAIGPGERYFLVEKPGFDVALMAGIEEELLEESRASLTSHNNTDT